MERLHLESGALAVGFFGREFKHEDAALEVLSGHRLEHGSADCGCSSSAGGRCDARGRVPLEKPRFHAPVLWRRLAGT